MAGGAGEVEVGGRVAAAVKSLDIHRSLLSTSGPPARAASPAPPPSWLTRGTNDLKKAHMTFFEKRVDTSRANFGRLQLYQEQRTGCEGGWVRGGPRVGRDHSYIGACTVAR
jgi:hypothetical protein